MAKPAADLVRVFPTQSDFSAWLAANHASSAELWVGYYRKGVGKTAMIYPEAVEEALCFGWIDGITYRIDDEVYATRMTPRRRGSNWSASNIAKVAELRAAGRMQPAGLRAFDERDPRKDAPYLRDRPDLHELPAEVELQIQAVRAAWTFWEAQRPGYRREAAFWIQSAVKPETRARRIASLIEDSAAGRPVKPLSYNQPKNR